MGVSILTARLEFARASAVLYFRVLCSRYYSALSAVVTMAERKAPVTLCCAGYVCPEKLLPPAAPGFTLPIRSAKHGRTRNLSGDENKHSGLLS